MDTEKDLKTFYDKNKLRQVAEHVKDGKDVSAYIEDVDEAINNYMVCSWPLNSSRC